MMLKGLGEGRRASIRSTLTFGQTIVMIHSRMEERQLGRIQNPTENCKGESRCPRGSHGQCSKNHSRPRRRWTPCHAGVARRAVRQQRPRHVRPDVSDACHPSRSATPSSKRSRTLCWIANPGDAARQQSQHPGRLHLFRPVRRPRHHARSHLARRQGEGPSWHRELPHPERRSRLRLRAWARTAARISTHAIPAAGNKHGPKLLIGKNITVDFGNVTGDFRNDLPRSPEGFALIGDHRNDENLLVAQTHLAMLKFHNAVCDMLSSSRQPAAGHLQGGAQDRHLALSVDRAARLGRAADRKGHRRQNPARRPQVLPLQESALHAGRVLGRRLSARPQHGPPALRPQQGVPGCRLPAAFRLQRPLGRHHRRPRAQPADGADAGAGLPSNWIIDWRRFYDLGASGGAAVTFNAVAQARPVSGHSRCTRCRAAAAISPSATSSAASISACHRARTSPST